MTLVRAFSGTWNKAHDGQSWLGFFQHLAAGMGGLALRGLFFLLLSIQRTRASPELASFIVVGRCWSVGKERLQQWLCPLCVTQQQCPASMAVQSSSIGIPCCRFPPSCPLSQSPHSQQQFLLRTCSPSPMHQLPGPLNTCEHMSQSGSCKAMVQTVCVFLILSHLPQIGCFTLFQQPQMLPFCPSRFPHLMGGFLLHRVGFCKFGNLYFASAPLPWDAGPILLPLLLLLPSFLHPSQLCRDLYRPFWCPRSSASFQLVFCENCCICRCIPDASVERDELYVHLLLCHLESLESFQFCGLWISSPHCFCKPTSTYHTEHVALIISPSPAALLSGLFLCGEIQASLCPFSSVIHITSRVLANF